MWCVCWIVPGNVIRVITCDHDQSNSVCLCIFLQYIAQHNMTNIVLNLVLFFAFKQETADAFYLQYQGKEFTSIEPALCRLVFVASMHFETDTGQQSTEPLPLSSTTVMKGRSTAGKPLVSFWLCSDTYFMLSTASCYSQIVPNYWVSSQPSKQSVLLIWYAASKILPSSVTAVALASCKDWYIWWRIQERIWWIFSQRTARLKHTSQSIT